MFDYYESLPEVAKDISKAIGGAIIGAITVFLNEKVKLKTLKKQNKELQDEKNLFTKEIEEIKKNHELDVSKRKYRYESKSKSYIEFFSMLDILNSNLNTNSIDNFKTALDEYNRAMVINSHKESGQRKALTIFQKKMQGIIIGSNNDLIKLRHETNSIRLIASDNVIFRLNMLEKGYDILMDANNKMLSKMPVLIIENDENTINLAKESIMKIGAEVETIKKDLIQTMRLELNEI